MSAWLLRKFGWRSFAALVLLFIALGSVAWGLADIVPGVNDNGLATAAMLGVLVGWALARLRYRGHWAALVIIGLGCLGVLYQFAQLDSPLLGLVRGLLAWLGNLLRWPESPPPDPTLLLAWNELLARLGALLGRLGAWLSGLFTRQASYDPLAAGLAWVLCLWLVAAWAGWHTFRRQNPLLGITPAGVLLAASLNYTRSSPTTLVILVGAVLFLMAVLRYDSHEQRWVAQRIDFAEDIELDSILAAGAIVAGLMLVSLASPSLSWQALVKLGREITQSYRQNTAQVAESLGLQPPPNVQAAGGLPRQHLLGAAPDVLRSVVMTIRTGELPPAPMVETLAHPPTRYYWRSVTYDIYTGRGWETSPTASYLYRAGEPALQDLPTDITIQQLVYQEVSLSRDMGNQMFFTGLLATANRPYRVNWRAPVAQAADPFGVLVSGSSQQALSYQATSIRTQASIEQLRTASGPIPEWVLARYLQLPETLPERVRQLTLELTAPGDSTETPSAYDKAAAIEAYLRTFPYTLDVPKPPAGSDVADYFLFELQQGYCDYYATAMVVLARAAGLPARLVIGYASGSYDAPTAQYVVTEADSHSWVEVYFAGIGWIEFEPTASQALIERPSRPGLPLNLPEIKPSGGWRDWLPNPRWDVPGWSAAGAILAFVIFNLWLEVDHWRLLHLAPAASIYRIYRRLTRHSHRLVQPLQPGATPHEFAARLKDSLAALGGSQTLRPLFSPSQQEIDGLTQLYTQAAYSPRLPSPTDRRQAVRLWWRLRWRLLLANGLAKLSQALARIGYNSAKAK